MMPDRPKVFCIGFHKTGTTSMNAALRALGYKTTSYFGVWDTDIAQTVHDKARARLTDYDAFEDMPWPCLYEELDAWAPGAKFVLTRRDTDRWYASMLKHFGTVSNPMREWIYGPGKGAPAGNEAHYKAVYEKHCADVRAYFADRPDDIVELSMEDGFAWEPLCALLGHPVPDAPFPRENTIRQRERYNAIMSLRRAAGRAARAIGLR